MFPGDPRDRMERLNFTWASDAHGSIVWAILFLHSYDTVADMFMTVVLFVIVAERRYGEKQRLGVHVDSVVWYFHGRDLASALRGHLLGPAHCGGAAMKSGCRSIVDRYLHWAAGLVPQPGSEFRARAVGLRFSDGSSAVYAGLARLLLP